MNNRNVGPEEGSWGSAWHGLEEIPAIGVEGTSHQRLGIATDVASSWWQASPFPRNR